MIRLSGKASTPGVLNGFLDHGCTVTGELRFEDTLRLDGTFRGKVVSEHELIIGDSADFDGEIAVGRVSINGRVKGTVRASERIEIHAAGRVTATLVAPILVVEEGALIEGTVTMGGATGNAEARGSEPRTEGEGNKVVTFAGGKRRDD